MKRRRAEGEDDASNVQCQEKCKWALSQDTKGPRRLPCVSHQRVCSLDWSPVPLTSKALLPLKALLKCRLPLWDGWLQGPRALAWEIPNQLLEVASIYHAWSAYSGPDSALRALHVLPRLLLLTVPWGHLYFPYCTQEKRDAFQRDGVVCLQSHKHGWQWWSASVQLQTLCLSLTKLVVLKVGAPRPGTCGCTTLKIGGAVDKSSRWWDVCVSWRTTGPGQASCSPRPPCKWDEAGPRKVLENKTRLVACSYSNRMTVGFVVAGETEIFQVAENHHPPAHGSIDSSKESGTKAQESPSKPFCHLGKKAEKLGSGEIEKEVTGTAEQKAWSKAACRSRWPKMA